MPTQLHMHPYISPCKTHTNILPLSIKSFLLMALLQQELSLVVITLARTVESQCAECNRKVGGEAVHRVIWVNLWLIFYSKKEDLENEGIKNHINDENFYELNLLELKKKEKKIPTGPQHTYWLSTPWANWHQAVFGATHGMVELCHPLCSCHPESRCTIRPQS